MLLTEWDVYDVRFGPLTAVRVSELDAEYAAKAAAALLDQAGTFADARTLMVSPAGADAWVTVKTVAELSVHYTAVRE